MSKRPETPPGGFRAPRVRKRQPGSDTADGDDALWFASRHNLIADAWQEPIVCDWFTRKKRNGQWSHGRCGLAVPRQNGKNAIIEIRELYGMVELGEAFLHTAHELKTARKAFKRLKYFFGESANDPKAKWPELNALVSEVRNANGQEAIFLKEVCEACGDTADLCACEEPELRRGGSIEIVARSSGSGRGFTVDVLVIDEAQHLSDEDLEAIRSAVSSAPLGNPQVIYTGTPPNREKGESGEAWIRIRTSALKENARRISWTEYGVPDGPMPDVDDTDLLYATNPSLGIRHANGAWGLTFDVVRDEREDLSTAGVARERFGWWGDVATKHRGVIDMEKWKTLRVAGDKRPSRGLVVVDVSPNLQWCSIGLATDGPDGRALVLVDRKDGTDWVVPALRKMVGDLSKVLEVALTPAAHIFAAKLTQAKVKHKVLTNSEVGRGCTAFQEMVRGGSTAHVGQAELDDAVRAAMTKYVGKTQQWDDRDRKVDITPLVVASVAAQRWAAATARPKSVPKPETVDTGVGGRVSDDDYSGGGSVDWNDVQF